MVETDWPTAEMEKSAEASRRAETERVRIVCAMANSASWQLS